MPPVKDPSLRYLPPEVVDPVRMLELAARGAVEGVRIGSHRSLLRGLSTEFTQHRAYTPGDDVKRIDWRVYSRTERYHVRLYEAETNYEAVLLLDASSSMRYGSRGRSSKLEYAKVLAAALAYLIVESRDSAGLAVFDGELRDFIPPKGSMSVLADLVEILTRTEDRPRTRVGGILQEFAARLRRRGFVILFSDLLDEEEGFIQGLNHLRFGGHNVIVFHVLDPDELTFPFDGFVRFEGLEGEEQILSQPDRIREEYLKALRGLTDRYRRACEDAGADYVLVDTGRPAQEVLVEYLGTRKVLSWAR
jgi:uncharacterized protein (DUF58 family)